MKDKTNTQTLAEAKASQRKGAAEVISGEREAAEYIWTAGHRDQLV